MTAADSWASSDPWAPILHQIGEINAQIARVADSVDALRLVMDHRHEDWTQQINDLTADVIRLKTIETIRTSDDDRRDRKLAVRVGLLSMLTSAGTAFAIYLLTRHFPVHP